MQLSLLGHVSLAADSC